VRRIAADGKYCASHTRPQLPLQAAAGSGVGPVIRAELIGSDTATALGVTVTSYTPVLALCRRLIEAGHDPDRPLQVYRANTPCLTISSIGVGGDYTVENNRVGTPVFRRWRDRAPSSGAAPPIRNSDAAWYLASRRKVAHRGRR
jgi:hypothetical protein